MAMPAGGEADARRSIKSAGIPEQSKAPDLAAAGRLLVERGALKVHLASIRFSSARKAHAAFLVEDLAACGSAEAADSATRVTMLRS